MNSSKTAQTFIMTQTKILFFATNALPEYRSAKHLVQKLMKKRIRFSNRRFAHKDTDIQTETINPGIPETRVTVLLANPAAIFPQDTATVRPAQNLPEAAPAGKIYKENSGVTAPLFFIPF